MQVIQLSHQLHQHRLIQTQSRRSDHGTLIYLLIQIIRQIIQISLFQAQRHFLLIILTRFSHQTTCIRTHVHKLILLTEIRHSAFALNQTFLQHLQLLIDKSDGLLCHHILALYVLQEINIT